jgi:prepilin-type N-terminal cleavage/methylation domain-containing protein
VKVDLTITTQRRQRRAPSGFSLVELMVALAVGGVALSSIYAIGSATTRNLRAQERVASAQNSLRVATERVKRDFQRAGFMGTPQWSQPGEACGSTPAAGAVAAVTNFVEDDVVAKAFAGPANENNESTFDAVTLMGNYATSGEYGGTTFDASGTVLTVSGATQSFRRDFTDWSTGAVNDAAFDEAFPEGRFVRVHALDETVHFGVIESRNAGARTVTISPGIPVATCLSATGGWMSPLNAIRYSVQAATGDEAPVGAATGPIAVLRRTELDGTTLNSVTPTPLTAPGGPVDDRAILDYVVRFDLDFRLAAAGVPNNTVAWLPATAAVVNASPQQIRSVVIDLAVRTPEQDPNMLYNINSLVSFRVFPVTQNVRGAARVRRARAEVLLPNVAVKDFL